MTWASYAPGATTSSKAPASSWRQRLRPVPMRPAVALMLLLALLLSLSLPPMFPDSRPSHRVPGDASPFLSAPGVRVHPLSPSAVNVTAHPSVSCRRPSHLLPLLPIPPPSSSSSATRGEWSKLLPDPLSDYARWHASARACLLSPSCPNKPPVLLFFCFLGHCNGVGDRVRFMRLAAVFALMTNRVLFLAWDTRKHVHDITVGLRPTYVDWTVPHRSVLDLRRADVSLRFRFPADTTVLDYPYEQSVAYDPSRPKPVLTDEQQKAMQVNVNTTDFKSWLEAYRVVRFNPRMHREEIQRLLNNVHLSDHRLRRLGRLSVVQLERIFNRFLFRPSPVVSSTAQRLAFPLLFPMSSSSSPYSTSAAAAVEPRYVALHARTGQDFRGLDDPQRFAWVNGDGRALFVARAAACIRRMARYDNTTLVFVASDSRSFKAALKARLAADKGPRLQVKSATRVAWHFDVGADSETRDDATRRCHSFVETFADAYALAGASSVAFVESSFAWLAVAIGHVRKWTVLRMMEGDGVEEGRRNMVGEEEEEERLLREGECVPEFMQSVERTVGTGEVEKSEQEDAGHRREHGR